MRGLIRVCMVAVMAIMVGCLSWSRQTYETQGDDKPPRVRHSSWSAGVLPARSPMETASADAIGTDAKTRSKYGYGIGGGYVGVGGSAGYGSMLYSRPYDVPPNRVLFIENHTAYPVKVALNGRVVGMIGSSLHAYFVSDNPLEHRLIFCAYETPGGPPLGQWQKFLGSNPGQMVHYRLRDDMFRGGQCPFS